MSPHSKVQATLNMATKKPDGGCPTKEDLNLLYNSTNSLISALNSYGIGAAYECSVVGADSPSARAPNEYNSTFTAPNHLFSSSSTTSSIPSSTSSTSSISTARPRRPHSQSSTPHNAQQLLSSLDALAVLLDSNDTRISLAPTGLHVQPQDNKLVLDVVACGTGLSSISPPREDALMTSTSTASKEPRSSLIQPLKFVAERGGQPSLFEHAQITNHYINSLCSLDEYNPAHRSEHLRTFNNFVKYTVAAHTEKIVHRIRSNALSNALWSTICSMPLPSKLPTASSRTSAGQAPSSADTGAHRAERRHSRLEQHRDRIFLERFLRKSIFVYQLTDAGVPITHLRHAALLFFLPHHTSASSASSSSSSSTPSSGFSSWSHANGHWHDGDGELCARVRDEFHILLVFLLHHEKGYLGRLASFSRLIARINAAAAVAPDVSDAPTSSPANGRAKEDAKRLHKKLSRACAKLTSMGILLRDLLATTAFKHHMRRIVPFLTNSLSAFPESFGYQLDDLSSRTNMDFNHRCHIPQLNLDCSSPASPNPEGNLGDRDDCEADSDDKNRLLINIYTKWLGGLVDHLEAVYHVQHCLSTAGRRMSSSNAARGVSGDGEGEKAPVGIDMTLIEVLPKESMGEPKQHKPPVNRCTASPPSSDTSPAPPVGGEGLKRKRQLTSTSSLPKKSAKVGHSTSLLPWRTVLLEAYNALLSDVPDTDERAGSSSPTSIDWSDVDPFLFDADTAIKVMEDVITESSLPGELYIPAGGTCLTSKPAVPAARYCPEGILASLLSLPTRSKTDAKPKNDSEAKKRASNETQGEIESTESYLIALSSPPCAACSSSLFPSLLPHSTARAATSISKPRPRNLPFTLSPNDTKSIHAASECTVPPFLSLSTAQSALQNAQRSLVKLINDRILERCWDDGSVCESEEEQDDGDRQEGEDTERVADTISFDVDVENM